MHEDEGTEVVTAWPVFRERGQGAGTARIHALAERPDLSALRGEGSVQAESEARIVHAQRCLQVPRERMPSSVHGHGQERVRVLAHSDHEVAAGNLPAVRVKE